MGSKCNLHYKTSMVLQPMDKSLLICLCGFLGVGMVGSFLPGVITSFCGLGLSFPIITDINENQEGFIPLSAVWFLYLNLR